MNVGQLMTRNVTTSLPDVPADDIGQLVIDTGFYGIPIVDEAGILLGLVSLGDMLARETRPLGALSSLSDQNSYQMMEDYRHRYGRTKGLTARDIMRKKIPILKENDSIVRACELLTNATLSIACVVDEGKLLGVISRSDLLRHLLKKKSDSLKAKSENSQKESADSEPQNDGEN